MKTIFNARKILIIGLIFLGMSSTIFATESFSSTNRMKSAIYLLWTEEGGVPQNYYIGQVRRNGMEIDEMVKARVDEHKNCYYAFKDTKKELRFRPLLSSGNEGWTYLETSLNEQAFMAYYCHEYGKILNARNQLSNEGLWLNWTMSGSDFKNLVASAKNRAGDEAVAAPIKPSCFTPREWAQ